MTKKILLPYIFFQMGFVLLFSQSIHDYNCEINKIKISINGNFSVYYIDNINEEGIIRISLPDLETRIQKLIFDDPDLESFYKLLKSLSSPHEDPLFLDIVSNLIQIKGNVSKIKVYLINDKNKLLDTNNNPHKLSTEEDGTIWPHSRRGSIYLGCTRFFNYPSEEIKATFLHELSHAILNSWFTTITNYGRVGHDQNDILPSAETAFDEGLAGAMKFIYSEKKFSEKFRDIYYGSWTEDNFVRPSFDLYLKTIPPELSSGYNITEETFSDGSKMYVVKIPYDDLSIPKYIANEGFIGLVLASCYKSLGEEIFWKSIKRGFTYNSIDRAFQDIPNPKYNSFYQVIKFMYDEAIKEYPIVATQFFPIAVLDFFTNYQINHFENFKLIFGKIDIEFKVAIEEYWEIRPPIGSIPRDQTGIIKLKEYLGKK